MRLLVAVAGGCAAAVVIIGTAIVAFLYGVGPAEHLIDRDTLHHF